MTDLDAVWLQNPLPFLGPEVGEMIGSKAPFPPAVTRMHGTALCMGFVLLRGQAVTHFFRDQLQMAQVKGKLHDDQRDINLALARYFRHGPEKMSYGGSEANFA